MGRKGTSKGGSSAPSTVEPRCSVLGKGTPLCSEKKLEKASLGKEHLGGEEAGREAERFSRSKQANRRESVGADRGA